MNSVERIGQPPATDDCATSFELLVTRGMEPLTNRTDWVAGCVEFQLP